MQKSLTNSGYCLSVPPPSLPSTLPFLAPIFFFFFFFLRAVRVTPPVSLWRRNCVCTATTEGRAKQWAILAALLCYSDPSSHLFSRLFSSSSSWVSNSVALHSSSYTCCSSRDTLEAHLDVFYCPHHFTTASCSFHCTSSVIQLVVRSSVCVWYTISLSLALLLFSLWEHHYHVKYIFILLWYKWMY